MNWLAENWYFVVALILLAASFAYNIYAFTKLSPAQQKEKVQQWLISAVCRAEKELGGGTGQIKLRTVYERFLIYFPWMAQSISFEEFSDMVDIALEKMREMLNNNAKIQEYVESGEDFNDLMMLMQKLAKKAEDK